MEVFLLGQCLLLSPVLQCCSKAWLAFKSLLTNPGSSALCQTPKSGLQRGKKTSTELWRPSPKKFAFPKAGTLCACVYCTPEKKKERVSVVGERKNGGGSRGGRETKRNPSLKTPEVWLGEAATERNALLLLLHGNYSCQKESRPICC